MQLKKYFGILLLGGCATTSGLFNGQSTTFDGDNILRDDVLRDIQKIERLAHECGDITAVNSEILDAKQINGLWQIKEQWTVQACGQSRIYPLELREDANGGTNFSIRVTP